MGKPGIRLKRFFVGLDIIHEEQSKATSLSQVKQISILKTPEQRPAHQRGKRPRYRRQNNQQRDGEPYCHRFKFLQIGSLSFSFIRADGNQDDPGQHHGHMLHPEKAELSVMHRIFKIVKKVSHYRADKIQPETDDQLYMRNGGGNVPHAIIELGKRLVKQPAPVTTVNSEK